MGPAGGVVGLGVHKGSGAGTGQGGLPSSTPSPALLQTLSIMQGAAPCGQY